MRMSSFSGGKIRSSNSPVVASDILSPYNDLNWQELNNYKTQFHTHTNATSNREPSVSENIAAHETAGFEAVGISDKELITRWSNASYSNNNVTEILNGEPTVNYAGKNTHWLKPFTDYVRDTSNVNTYLTRVAENGGLSIIPHTTGDGGTGGASYGVAVDYEPLLSSHPTFVGFSIICGMFEMNTGRPTGYSGFLTGGIDDFLVTYGRQSDEDLRPFLFGESDWSLNTSHEEFYIGNDVGMAWQEVLAPDRTTASLKSAVQNGAMFWGFSPDGLAAPSIDQVNVSGTTITLTVTGDYDEIRWIYNKQTIATGNTFTANDRVEGQTYVRAEVWKYRGSTQWRQAQGGYTQASVVGTQPFYFKV